MTSVIPSNIDFYYSYNNSFKKFLKSPFFGGIENFLKSALTLYHIQLEANDLKKIQSKFNFWKHASRDMSHALTRKVWIRILLKTCPLQIRKFLKPNKAGI